MIFTDEEISISFDFFRHKSSDSPSRMKFKNSFFEIRKIKKNYAKDSKNYVFHYNKPVRLAADSLVNVAPTSVTKNTNLKLIIILQ
jgi:hypothetical protein